jgi:hypothetical protein
VGRYPACLAGCCFLGLIAGQPAHAINPNQIAGDWQSQTQNVCLYAPGGFNAQLRPNNPAESYVVQNSTLGTVTYSTPTSISPSGLITGNVTRNFNILANSFPASATNTTFVPAISRTVISDDVQTYQIQIGSSFVRTIIKNETGSILSGPRGGQTQVINFFVLEGYASADHKTIYLADPDVLVENITYSGGGLAAPETYPRICHRTTTLTKTQ